MNNKAAKLGFAPVTITYGATVEQEVSEDILGKYPKMNEAGKPRWYALYQEITLEGDAPIIDGWEFIAVVDLRGEKPMVRKQPFLENDVDLTEYFDTDSRCDHCKSSRRRNDVLIIRNTETGELMQIGRNCAADHFGTRDATSRLATTDWSDAYGFVSETNSPKAEPYSSVERMYQTAAAVVEKFGWVGHKEGMYDDTLRSTRGRVWQNLFPNPAHMAKFPEDYVTVEDAHKEEAIKVMEWLREKFLNKAHEDCTEFEMKVRAACEGPSETPMVRDRNLNMLIWGIGGYQRDLQKDAEKRIRETALLKEKNTSVFVGKIKERRDFTLTLKLKRVFGSNFGPRYMQKFVDADNNVFVWWGTNATAENTVVGNTYVFKATIKAHDEYNGVSQTILTRATLLEGELDQKEYA